ncbi:MAG: hypothetical protein LUD50_00725, partial [Clostridia bacterium]|nr:hypothetical protein [Clostridia bacterium]
PAEGEAPAEETAAEEEKPAEPEPEPEPVKPPEPEYEEIIVEEPLPPHPGEYYTVYPDGIKYANYEICKDNLCFADNGADKTCWYEWTAVGLYARKYIEERTGNDNIALVGVREGGEVIWKMAAVRQFRCAIPVCAAGFKTSAGKLKFEKPVSAPLKAARPEAKEAERHGKEKKGARAEEEESHMNYNFIAGVDSQAYAPNVMCPVLMLCSVNDPRFDYDRAYDTYLRINPDYIQESGLSYAMNSNSFIDKESIADMYIFLRKFLMGHHVFQPRMVAVDIDVGRQQELLARVMADQEGVVKKFRVYYAEDTVNPVLRTWINAEPIKGGAKNEYSLNVYEGAKTVFVIAAAEYTNGYTSWSNVTVKTISGRFRNMLHRSPLIYSSLLQNDGFISVGLEKKAIGGIILEEGVSAAPENIELDGIKGIYAPDGMMTYRISKPRYAPDDKSILSLDINTVNDANIYITITDLKTHEDYVFTDYLTGGLWQSLKLSACTFKCGRKPLNSFCREAVLTIRAEGLYAVNNIMWL